MRSTRVRAIWDDLAYEAAKESMLGFRDRNFRTAGRHADGEASQREKMYLN